ncbi:DUF418 domain-containing protein [Goodfellowiella coeruleoviolacea]|uniref:DUF418 domain-containing protein n=1 Tax=Goodfellowiella coeruleoviolacea TaxID=334858 RepID=UPI0027DEE92F|nr:DUF418 domain-containing protein [Goodfellowiella coeruleoviolacea]
MLRGTAILGTLGTNIWILTNPEGIIGFLNGAFYPGFTSLAAGAETLLRFLANGKSLALLTLLFGVGLEIQRQSAARRGRRWPGRYLWRATLLLVDGFLHYLLVVEFDVLMGYAVTSVVVAYLVATSARASRGWLVAAGALHVLLVGLATAALALLPAGQGGNPPPVTLYTEGGYLDQIRFRWEYLPLMRAEAVFILPMAVFLFLLGARLYRAGVFGADERGRMLRRRMLAVGLGVGLPLNVATTVSGLAALVLVDRYLIPPLVAIGLIGLVGWLVDRRGQRDGQPGQGWLARRLALVGRMALSCYMLQNLLGVVLCYGWGFGLAARFGANRTLWTVVLFAGICAALMAFSTLWLRRFSQGPVEIVWRWAYERPFRRSAESDRVAAAPR